MPTEITVPRLGWSMEEAVFSAWLKGDGERVRAGEMLFAIESEKATQEVESFDAGLLHIPPHAPKQGDTVVVGQLIGYLLAEGERAPLTGSPSNERPPVLPAKHAAGVPALPKSGPTIAETKSEAPISTPRARRVAGELCVDWSQVPGTGRGGRIREVDIRSAATLQPSVAPISKGRLISPRTVAGQATLHTTADATVLVGLTNELKLAESNIGTIFPACDDFLMKFAALALRKHPVVNSCWNGETLVTSRDIHISIAVATEDRVLQPVIRDVARLPFREIAARSRDLAERARSEQLNGDELSGGTFTISNLGAFGIDAFTPMVNPPQCATLGIGRILRQPVAVGDSVVLRDIITLSLAFDHRAFGELPAARFLQTLTGLIEAPHAALLSPFPGPNS